MPTENIANIDHRAAEILTRGVDPETRADVLDRMMDTTTDRVRFLIYYPSSPEDEKVSMKRRVSGEEMMDLHLPVSDDPEHFVTAAKKIRSDVLVDGEDWIEKNMRPMFTMMEENLGRFSLWLNEMFPDRFPELIAAVQKRFPVDAETPLTDEMKRSILAWFLNLSYGEKKKDSETTYNRRVYKHPDATLQKIITLMDRSLIIRTKMLCALQSQTMKEEDLLANTLLLYGVESLQETKAVSDYEWWQSVNATAGQQLAGLRDALQRSRADRATEKKIVDTIEAAMTPEANEALLDALPELIREQERIARAIWRRPVIPLPDDINLDYRQIRKDAKKYLSTHEPEEAAYLRDVIECERFFEELEKIRTMHNPDGLEAKELELAYRIYQEVLKFRHGHTEGQRNQQKNNEGFTSSYPVTVKHKKLVNCFSGPALMAAMFMEAGIPSKQLLFLKSHRYELDGQVEMYAPHAALVFVTSEHRIVPMDYGYKKIQTTFPDPDILTDLTQGKIMALCEGARSTPVEVRTQNFIRGHYDFQLMPLGTGLGTAHMLHNGVQFLQEGKLDEAEHAFDLGLNIHSRDADLQYFRGIVEFLRGKLDHAEERFLYALDCYGDHLDAIYSLGELQLAKGNPERARYYFECVVQDRRKVFGDAAFKDRAKRYVAATDDAMLGLWHNGGLTGK